MSRSFLYSLIPRRRFVSVWSVIVSIELWRRAVGKWTRRTQLIPSQLAVVIFIEFQQGIAGIGNFLRVDDAIMVRV